MFNYHLVGDMGRIKKYLKEGEKWFCFELDEFEIKYHSEGDDYQVRGRELELGLTLLCRRQC